MLNLQNLSGDESMAWTGVVLQDAVSAQLSRDHGAQVIDPARSSHAMHDLGFHESDRPTAEEAKALERELGANDLLTGNYLGTANELCLDLALV